MPTFPLIDLHQDLLAHLNHLEMFPRGTQTDFDMLKRQSTKIVTVTAFPIPPQDDYLNPVTNDLIEQDFEGYIRHTLADPSWVILKTHMIFNVCLSLVIFMGCFYTSKD